VTTCFIPLRCSNAEWSMINSEAVEFKAGPGEHRQPLRISPPEDSLEPDHLNMTKKMIHSVSPSFSDLQSPLAFAAWNGRKRRSISLRTLHIVAGSANIRYPGQLIRERTASAEPQYQPTSTLL
jgi:hypothetical protein